MRYGVTESFERKVRKLTKRNSRLTNRLVKQFSQFEQDPRHPSLKLHKLTGSRSTQHAIWLTGNLRAVAIKSKNVYVFFDIITHDEY